MTRPRRWRWWGKWATLTLAVLIAVAWLASGWYWARIMWYRDGRGGAVFLWSGCVWCRVMEGPPETTRLGVRAGGLAAMGRTHPTWDWRFSLDNRPPRPYVSWELVCVPLWALFLPAAASSAWLWRLDRRGPPNSCPHCRYDLSATPPSAPCPECGREQQRPDARAVEAAERTTP
jgi:hypothetical protein